MGRHSAAGGDDEDDRQQAQGGAVAVEAPGRPGRHSRGGDEDDQPVPIAPAAPVVLTKPRPGPDVDAIPTDPLPPTDAESTVPLPPVDAAPTEPLARVEAAPLPSAGTPAEPDLSPTARDFALLRTHPDVRNRAIAALLVPFVAYAVVMVVTGRSGDFLIWIWTPLILAGVLVGLMLDLGHKRYGTKESANRP